MLVKFVDWFVFGLWGLDKQNPFVASLHFFIYDSLKIIALLFAMVFVMGVVRTFLPAKRLKEWMGRQGVLANVYAVLFGAVTPFCSCSSIPIFISFIRAGIPLGVAFSFLITSPVINEYLVVLMLGFLGWKITLVYVASGLLIGIIGGILLGQQKFERFLVRDFAVQPEGGMPDIFCANFYARLAFGRREAVTVVKKTWFWVLAGVGVGALIHNYVPPTSLQAILAATGIFSVPLAVLAGVPIYGSCAAIVPVAVVLFQKGVPVGTAMAFMMAVAALSLPEAVLLRRALRLNLILLFFGITAAAIMFTGYLLNFFQPIFLSP